MASISHIDIEKPDQLLRYLRQRNLIAADAQPGLEALRGGVSNRTVWVRRENGADWVIKQALPKLRVQVDWFSDPARIGREAAGLRRLSQIIPGQVPEFVFADAARNILAMTAVPQPHENWKSALLRGALKIEHARAFGRLLARIHSAVDFYPALAEDFAERRFFEELRLEPYYSYAASQVPKAAPFLTRLVEDTRSRRFALVHGDYSPKNVLIHDDRLILLDYEVIHFGDPAFDIGFSLTHFLSKAHHLPAHRQAFLEMARRYWQSYLDELAPRLREPVRELAVKHTLACLLARVAGRSPLEYLNEAQRSRQMRIVVALIAQDISGVLELIDAFAERLRQADE